MKVVAVIPVHGRLPLVKHTIDRLLNLNGVDQVLTAGAEDDSEVCRKMGSWFHYHDNQPLGKKWNYLFQQAREWSPDAVLFVGSSDWISDNWIPEMSQHLGEYAMVGKPDFYLADIAEQIRVCHWKGYTGERKREPIGIGRMLSREILEKMNWKPFLDDQTRSLDYQMLKSVLANEGKVKLITGTHIKSLSISCPKWPNLHQFEDHWTDKLPSEKIYDHNFLHKNFPEAFKIF